MCRKTLTERLVPGGTGEEFNREQRVSRRERTESTGQVSGNVMHAWIGRGIGRKPLSGNRSNGTEPGGNAGTAKTTLQEMLRDLAEKERIWWGKNRKSDCRQVKNERIS